VTCNFQTGKSKIKMLTEYENVTQRVLLGIAVLAALMSGRKCDVIIQNGDCRFSTKIPLPKRNVVTELNMEETHLQVMLSDVG
jgi:hypothetical protein